MVELIRQQTTKARKEYHCDGTDYTSECASDVFTPDELVLLEKVKQEKYRIFKGTKYISQFNRSDGDVYTWRCREDIYNLLIKYQLFDDM